MLLLVEVLSDSLAAAILLKGMKLNCRDVGCLCLEIFPNLHLYSFINHFPIFPSPMQILNTLWFTELQIPFLCWPHSRELDQRTSAGPFQPKPSCDFVKMSARWTVRSTSRHIGNVVSDTSKSTQYLRKKKWYWSVGFITKQFIWQFKKLKNRIMENLIRTITELPNI